VIPQPAKALADLAVKLATGIAPETSSSYAMANTGLISMLLLALAQDHDRAAANRMADIGDMQTLFRDVARRHPNAPGAAARDAFCDGAPAGLRISELDTFHAEGLAALIDLHAWAEVHDADLALAIWDFLAQHTERNRFDLPAS
jgi:hypothetical protein